MHVTTKTEARGAHDNAQPASTPVAQPASQPATRSMARGAEWYGATTAQVLAFFGQLRRVPIGAWCQLAEHDPHLLSPDELERQMAAMDLARETQADSQARAHLREVMETMPNAVRRIRNRIDREIGIIEGIAAPATVRRLRRAARLAACAIAARPLLSPGEFARLYRPFEELIPPTAIEAQ
jgi:hypothetical protein